MEFGATTQLQSVGSSTFRDIESGLQSVTNNDTQRTSLVQQLVSLFRSNATEEEIAQAQKVLDIRAAQATEKTAEGTATRILDGIEVANFILSSGLVVGAVATGRVIPILTALFLAKDDIINAAGYVTQNKAEWKAWGNTPLMKTVSKLGFFMGGTSAIRTAITLAPKALMGTVSAYIYERNAGKTASEDKKAFWKEFGETLGGFTGRASLSYLDSYQKEALGNLEEALTGVSRSMFNGGVLTRAHQSLKASLGTATDTVLNVASGAFSAVAGSALGSLMGSASWGAALTNTGLRFVGQGAAHFEEVKQAPQVLETKEEEERLKSGNLRGSRKLLSVENTRRLSIVDDIVANTESPECTTEGVELSEEQYQAKVDLVMQNNTPLTSLTTQTLGFLSQSQLGSPTYLKTELQTYFDSNPSLTAAEKMQVIIDVTEHYAPGEKILYEGYRTDGFCIDSTSTNPDIPVADYPTLYVEKEAECKASLTAEHDVCSVSSPETNFETAYQTLVSRMKTVSEYEQAKSSCDDLGEGTVPTSCSSTIASNSSVTVEAIKAEASRLRTVTSYGKAYQEKQDECHASLSDSYDVCSVTDADTDFKSAYTTMISRMKAVATYETAKEGCDALDKGTDLTECGSALSGNATVSDIQAETSRLKIATSYGEKYQSKQEECKTVLSDSHDVCSVANPGDDFEAAYTTMSATVDIVKRHTAAKQSCDVLDPAKIPEGSTCASTISTDATIAAIEAEATRLERIVQDQVIPSDQTSGFSRLATTGELCIGSGCDNSTSTIDANGRAVTVQYRYSDSSTDAPGRRLAKTVEKPTCKLDVNGDSVTLEEGEGRYDLCVDHATPEEETQALSYKLLSTIIGFSVAAGATAVALAVRSANKAWSTVKASQKRDDELNVLESQKGLQKRFVDEATDQIDTLTDKYAAVLDGDDGTLKTAISNWDFTDDTTFDDHLLHHAPAALNTTFNGTTQNDRTVEIIGKVSALANKLKVGFTSKHVASKAVADEEMERFKFQLFKLLFTTPDNGRGSVIAQLKVLLNKQSSRISRTIESMKKTNTTGSISEGKRAWVKDFYHALPNTADFDSSSIELSPEKLVKYVKSGAAIDSPYILRDSDITDLLPLIEDKPPQSRCSSPVIPAIYKDSHGRVFLKTLSKHSYYRPGYTLADATRWKDFSKSDITNLYQTLGNLFSNFERIERVEDVSAFRRLLHLPAR